MKPIEKNIIVIDEQGNEYEATYLKRAKGLVKNGRARFIDENTICLACPPNDRLEDNIMSENKEINVKVQTENKDKEQSIITSEEKTLTTKEIFNQICLLQKELTSNSAHSLYRLSETIDSICADENEDKNEQIYEVCNVFMAREDSFNKMIDFYRKIYADIANSEAYDQKIRLVKEVFSSHTSNAENYALTPEDSLMAINYITDRIATLTEKILIPASTKTEKSTIIDEMSEMLKSPDVGPVEKEHARDVLKAYMKGH